MIPENLNKLTEKEMQLVSGGSPVGFIIYLPKKTGAPREYYERLSRLIPAIKSGLSQFNFVDIEGNPITINNFFREPLRSIIRSSLQDKDGDETVAIAYVIDDLRAQKTDIIKIYS